MTVKLDDIREDITSSVARALAEDIGEGDITAQLIPPHHVRSASIFTREPTVICGQAWAEETFKQLGGLDHLQWHVEEGESVEADTPLASLRGNARTLLTGERTALNFLQLLCGVATKAQHYAKGLGNAPIRLLDTRKTLPGLRLAQKYAVSIGGCHNHRIGLYDAFLIKENHILACGGIQAAIERAHSIAPEKPVEVEVETLKELQEAIDAGANTVMLDNFSENMLNDAKKIDKKTTRFELSGNLELNDLQGVDQLPIDFCSFGDLTKNVRAIDLSMRLHD